MLSEYKNQCKYDVGTLKPFIYLLPTSAMINYTVDNGDAIVNGVSGTISKLNCGVVTMTSEETINGRFKFNNRVVVKMFENSVDGLMEILNNLVRNGYRVVVEDLKGTQYIMNVEFTASVTYDYNFSSNVISPNTCTITFSTDSNFPTLALINPITPSNIIRLPQCEYNTGRINILKLCDIKNTYIVRDENRFSGVYATGAYQGSPYKTIDFVKNSFSFTENFDGSKYTHTLTFSIPLSDYKSYWQYNLIEFKNNKYVALFSTINGNTIASGYNNGYFPSYTITTSDSVATLNMITITMTHISEQCFAYNNEKSLDDLINKDVRIIYTNVPPFFTNGKYFTTSACINNKQSADIVLQEMSTTGEKLNNYWVLEGYESHFKDSELNIVGNYRLNSSMNGYNFIYNNSSCFSFNVCSFIQTPDPIYYLDYNTKSVVANIQSNCDWSIVDKPQWINVSAMNGSPDINYSITISSNVEQEMSGTFTIVTGDSTYSVTVNYSPLAKWIKEEGEYICVGEASYEMYYKYVSEDGVNWTKTNEIRSGAVIENPDKRCTNYEYISDTERWVLEDNMYICEEDTGGGGQTINYDNCLIYETTGTQNYIIVDGYKYSLPPDRDYIYVGNDFTMMKFYEAPAYDGDPLYNIGLKKLDFSHIKTPNLNTMYRMFHNCSDLEEIVWGDNFTTDNVTNMKECFLNCSSLKNLTVSHFNTEKVTSMSGMFSHCRLLTELDLDNFSVPNLKSVDNMFENCTSLKDVRMCQFGSGYWNYNNIFYGVIGAKIHSSEVFINYLRSVGAIPSSFTIDRCGASAPRSNILTYTLGTDSDGNSNYVTVNGTRIHLSGTEKQLDSNIESLTFKFYTTSSGNVANNLVMINMSDVDTSSITNMSEMFRTLHNLRSVVAKFDTSSATSMQSMFAEDNALVELNLSNFNTSSVTDMSGMFANDTSLEYLDLSNFDITNVTSFSQMFFNCTKLRDIVCTQAFKDFCQNNKSGLGMDSFFDLISWTILT